MKIFTNSLQRKKKHFAMMINKTELQPKRQQQIALLDEEQQQTPLLLTEPTMEGDGHFEMTNNEQQDAFFADDVSLSMILSHFPPRNFEDDSFSFSSQDDEESDFMMESENFDRGIPLDIPLDIPLTLTIDFSKTEVLAGYRDASKFKSTKISVKKWRRVKHTRRLKSISPR